MKTRLFFCLLISCIFKVKAQTNAPSIQTGVTFQWSDTQTDKKQPATIKSVTVNDIVYLNFGLPTGYELTQLGGTGHSANRILENGVNIETTSASATWSASALSAFQDLNLNHYFNSSGNGVDICDNFTAEETTTAQRQTLTYGTGILATSSGVIAVTERNANNCLHLELFGIPLGGGAEQSLGETFINKTSTKYGFGGTGSSSNLGTPGANNPPNSNSDYWLSDRVVENSGTIGIALFYLDDIAPNGSLITKAQLTASTSDHADGKLFIFTLEDADEDGYSDVDDLDDDNDGIKDLDESGGNDPSADDDLDGVSNYKDPDFCTLNAFGICEDLDADNDGIANHLDLDSDNDGITDVVESQGIDADNDGVADGSIGITAATNGIPSSAGTGTTPVNTDGDTNSSGNRYLLYDFLDIDSDDDGIPDNVEAQPTIGYLIPNGTVSVTGIDSSYGLGIIVEDTDGDGIPDYRDLDSDNDGIDDEAENGLPYPSTDQDKDKDGLINPFETTNIDDPSWDVNEDIENPSDLSILPDADGDLASGGDLDYRDLFNTNPPASASIDFDGVDDYLDSNLDLSGYSQATVMAWVKTDPAFSSDGTVVSQGNLEIKIISSRRPVIYLNGASVTLSSSYALASNIWNHIAIVFDKSLSSDKLKVYVNGELAGTSNNALLNSVINTSTDAFTIGKESGANSKYFNGDIDEVRVFNVPLTANQVQKIIYQEIQEVSNDVSGVVIPKVVIDNDTSSTISWDNLQGYYPMTNILNSTTDDYSSKNHTAQLHNITTIQEQTAPMPYITMNDGEWETENTWLYGDVWDISTTSTNKDWNIVKISNEVSACHDVKTLGLIIGTGSKLTVHTDKLLQNDWYLELNGTIDLLGDAQLIQTETSDLVTSADGKLLRRQEGAPSAYWYNYWGSPVGAVGATSLTNNNAATNNTNNSGFRLDLIKDDSGYNCQFTSNYTGNGTISTYWLFNFINGVGYWDWYRISTSTPIQPGVGYTQKGTGVPGTEQQYLFEGKPNNGTILINAIDTGGAGSVPSVTKTEYLLGNPYASALDVHKFIDDNEGVIGVGGSIKLWQQWSGASHNLRDYNGGYAQVNKLGSIRAYQFVGREGAHNGSQDGTIVPSRYLSVGQGFMVEVVNSGTIEFNNSQRIFIKESDADGTYYNGSVFSKSSGGKAKDKQSKVSSEKENSSEIFKKIRLEFESVSGPATHRELLLGFNENTSDDFDYGYDAENFDINNNDLHLDYNGVDMNIQAYGEVTHDKVVPLNFKSSGENSFEIKISEQENFESHEKIFLRDNTTGSYFDLTAGLAYSFSTDQGKFNTRFEIVFESEQQSLSSQEVVQEENFVYYQNSARKLYGKKLKSSIKRLAFVNMLGQSVLEFQDVSEEVLKGGLDIPKLATGAYVVYFRAEDNSVFSKKIIVN